LKIRENELPHPSVAVAVANEGIAGQFMTEGAGSDEMTGAVTSCTFIVCVAVDEFPHASVAVHFLVMLYDPAHTPPVVTSVKIKLKALPHASVAVATANIGVAGQLIVVDAGSAAITGAVTS
jgi:hypothetical protein